MDQGEVAQGASTLTRRLRSVGTKLLMVKEKVLTAFKHAEITERAAPKLRKT